MKDEEKVIERRKKKLAESFVMKKADRERG